MPAKLSKQWTAAELAIVKRDWPKGISASNIARQLPGRSKSAVVGLVHREGIVRTVPPAPRTKRDRPAPRTGLSRSQIATEGNLAKKIMHHREPAPAPRPAKREKPKPYTGPTVAFDGLTPDGCRWPVTDDKPYRFCSGKAQQGSPYCAEHARRSVRTGGGE